MISLQLGAEMNTYPGWKPPRTPRNLDDLRLEFGVASVYQDCLPIQWTELVALSLWGVQKNR